MSSKNWINTSAFIMATAVAFGALGAHALKDLLNNEQLELWNKGVLYQMIHGIGLLGICLLSKYNAEINLKWCFYLMIIGIIFFSGSLYLIALNKGILGEIELLKRIMIPITPLGGSCLIISWILLAIKAK